MTRTGKIARLPLAVREELNRRLQDNEPGSRLVEWLNGLPETRQVLAAGFDGRPVTEQNLSEWKQGGHRDWLARQETLACARDLAGEAAELAGAAGGSLADHLATVLTGRYAALVAGWNGEMDEEFRRRTRALRLLCQDIGELRRGDHCAGRLRLDFERFADAQKSDLDRGLDALAEQIRQWPDVREAFAALHALVKQRESGSPPGNAAPAPPTAVRPNPT